jgi:hypothetical protein
MTRIYIAGPMSNMPDHNLPAFAEAAERLAAAGYETVNPGAKGVIDGWSWADYLRDDLPRLLAGDGVAVLDGWHESRGARLEVYVATQLDMDVRAVDDWLLQVTA